MQRAENARHLPSGVWIRIAGFEPSGKTRPLPAGIWSDARREHRSLAPAAGARRREDEVVDGVDDREKRTDGREPEQPVEDRPAVPPDFGGARVAHPAVCAASRPSAQGGSSLSKPQRIANGSAMSATAGSRPSRVAKPIL